ncbi:MerR family transcriptional regulator [Lysinibacillus yapensis]|uniref:MerR family transcriptional regulator n=1 Tax=Ureibacillus yapensis TaxID=2304605 RepID=A0A396S9F8_9BACL|nr:MerR family transcriptional regulator [Lysinibacillus yapensis]RHW37534.1 MerR family transcriptional regulator [Lysinibacillus yapensis]
MSDLANKAGVTKRTIDYYTNLGLLEMDRSPSNYRLYPVEMVERIHWIEEQKNSGKCLSEIAKLIGNETTESKPFEEVNIHEIRLQMKKLEKDVSKMMENLDEREKQQLKQKVTPESVSLIQSLILLLQ